MPDGKRSTIKGSEKEYSLEVLPLSNKKGGEVSTFFAPNLTMNLTYLCYGKS